MNRARLAYANARVRALKSRLRRRADLTGTSAAPGGLLPELLDCYRTILRSYPAGQPVSLALLRLHEVENVKLAWRAYARGHSPSRWSGLWQPLGDLESIALDDCTTHTSIQDFVRALEKTPYRGIARSTFRAHPADPAAAEFALDGWSSAALLRAAEELPPAERGARTLVRAIVRERDISLLRRGAHAFALSPDAVLAGLVVLPAEATRDELVRLATWTVDQGALARGWPRAWRRLAGTPGDWDGVMLALKRWRRAECARAFLSTPYSLAPAVALLLLKEEELIGAAALAESAGRAASGAALTRALAASVLGMEP
jgi:ATP synthase C subunit